MKHKPVVVRTPVPTVEEMRKALGMSKKRAEQIKEIMATPQKKTLKIRILEAVAESDEQISYHVLKYKVYPPDQYPRAHRHSSNGGPPGCAFAIGRALNEMKKDGLIYRGPARDSRGYWVWQPDIYLTSKGRKVLNNERTPDPVHA